MKPVIEITYCPRCGWLMRSAWMAQELLTTFAGELGAVTLKPAETAGVFEIKAGEAVVWSRVRDGGFPDIVALKRLVRDAVAPGKALGHADRKADPSAGQ
jgi:selenoprotein W-related protein